MSVARWTGGVWGEPSLEPVGPLALHPGAHALHYGSSCFEGLKAHRGEGAGEAGGVRIFRLVRHMARLRASASALCLPVPPAGMLEAMVTDVVRTSLDEVPEAPGSLYLRPTLIGTEANIGAAAKPSTEALLFVLASPVGDYFAAGGRPLVLAVETGLPRTTPAFGTVKAGANYAMALGATMRATGEVGADQVLFAPGGVIQETGASNFVLIDDDTVITPARDGAFLNGVTLDSLLVLAADLGYRVEERTLTVAELLARAGHPGCEAALSGTAAVLAGVGELVYDGTRTTVGNGSVGAHTTRLRRALTDLCLGRSADRLRWTTPVCAYAER